MTTQDKKRDLPARPSLDHLKSQAKDLLDAVRNGDADALARIRANLPDAASMQNPSVIVSSVKLHDAQSVIAREYGVASWAELRDRVESMVNASALHPMNLPASVLEAMSIASREPLDVPSDLPSELPLIPVRNALLTTGIAAPLHIGRSTSIEAIRALFGRRQSALRE